MKQLLTLMILCITLSLTAQVKRDSAGNFYETPFDTTTTYTYIDASYNVHKVYVTKNGKFYILKRSKKTGKLYKQYLKLEV